MRLFIAINFTKEEKKQVLAVQNELKTKAVRGNFTREQNFHLTLAFLGEIEENRLPVIQKVMDGAEKGNFSLDFNKVSAFRRSGGSLYYLAARPEKKAERLADYLKRALQNRGFSIDDKPFVPHLTIGREVALNKDEHITVAPFKTQVDKISLMKSERIKGVLTYTSIYDTTL